jgi:hypothetical protein
VYSWQTLCTIPNFSARPKASVPCLNTDQTGGKVRAWLLLSLAPSKVVNSATRHFKPPKKVQCIAGQANTLHTYLMITLFVVMSMSHTIPQLQSIFSRMMQLVGKTGGYPSTGPGTEDYSRRNENNPQQAACAEPRYYGTCSIPTDDEEEKRATEEQRVL